TCAWREVTQAMLPAFIVAGTVDAGFSRKHALLRGGIIDPGAQLPLSSFLVSTGRQDRPWFRQQKTTEALVARLNEQEASIQKVSAQVEMGKSGSQMLVE